MRKRDWVLHTRRLMEREFLPAEVERRAKLKGDEFYESYCAVNRPVILTDAVADWPALERWTPEYLQSRCGTETVEIQARRDSNPNYEVDKNPHLL